MLSLKEIETKNQEQLIRIRKGDFIEPRAPKK